MVMTNQIRELTTTVNAFVDQVTSTNSHTERKVLMNREEYPHDVVNQGTLRGSDTYNNFTMAMVRKEELGLNVFFSISSRHHFAF